MTTLKQPIEIASKPDSGLVVQSGPGGALVRIWGNDTELLADLDRDQAKLLASALRHSAGVYTGDNVPISLFQQQTPIQL